MEENPAMRIIRQMQIIRFLLLYLKCTNFTQRPLDVDPIGPRVNQDLPNMASPPIQQQQQQQPLAPKRNSRCINFFSLLVIYFIGIGSIVLGAIHLNDCPAEKMLPKGLIIFGGLIIVRRLLNCVSDWRSICKEFQNEDPNQCFLSLNLLICLAEFGMFIALSYYAFSVVPSTDPLSYNMQNYCDYGLFMTSFIGCIELWKIFEIIFLCLCCSLCCLCCSQEN